ncbi:helix-turn-helix domain-containing protein [Deinococcus arenicola]|uniref:Helix-turn-helix transcriptional regulator n=1 Tax=Deinococcus arenicola TaxID=2994950 RepID=A0ABU4DWM5_9DEIO|nr:helix-turn-helix transcriptional regulator [Deinococcus sp. ZS9-10]MDV6376454.1 helix-turn-helix transcriptional regulator [Deinococcus sp. ZS9-10]
MPQTAEIDIYEKLRGYIKRSGKSQRQLSDEVGIPQPSYLSHMANGRVNWVEGDYFRPLSEALGLSKEEIRELKPEIIWEDRSPTRPGPPIPPVVPFRETPISIPPELLQMVEKHGDAYPVLKTAQMQRMLAAPRNFGGAEVGPQTAEDWFDYWMANKRFLT